MRSTRLGYYGEFKDDKWVLEHRRIWEEANGPIPAGYVIHHLDGNKKNNTLDNLVCISRSEHMRIHKNGQYADRKKPIIIITQDGSQVRYSSTAEASSELTRLLGVEISARNIYNCLSRRQKSMITPEGRITAVYEGESTEVNDRFAKKGNPDYFKLGK